MAALVSCLQVHGFPWSWRRRLSSLHLQEHCYLSATAGIGFCLSLVLLWSSCYYCWVSQCCTTGTKEHTYLDDNTIPRCYDYSLCNSFLNWLDNLFSFDFFFQLHLIDLKITILSASSAFLFDQLWQQDEVIWFNSQTRSTNSPQIDMSFVERRQFWPV